MMIKNVNLGIKTHSFNFSKQSENKNNNVGRQNGFNILDKIEISNKAREALNAPPITHPIIPEPMIPEESENTLEQILEDYNNSSKVGLIDKTEDNSTGEEQKSRLTAIKIAMRIANGDNVPMKDHRWLAEYDSKMYMEAMKASLMADNKDPKDYESLIDDTLDDLNATMRPDVEDTELDSDVAAEDFGDAPVESVDAYY